MIGEKKKGRIYIGSDHAGFDMKGELNAYLEENGYDVVDLGSFTPEPVDYPDIAREVGEKVSENHGARGVLICGSGIGVAIAANKIQGIRATVAVNEEMAVSAREHNDINVVTLGARTTDLETAKKIVMAFLNTEFESTEERRVRRVEKIDQIGRVMEKS